MFALFFIFSFIILKTFANPFPEINDIYHPIIAVLSTPVPSDTDEVIMNSTIWGGYVRWLEQAGAQIIPIHPWYNPPEIDRVLQKSNGVLFLGGNRTVNISHRYEATMHYIFNKVIQMNDQKDYYPLFAICFGFEAIPAFVANNNSIVGRSNCKHKYIKSELTENAHKSRLFSNFNTKELDMINNTNATFQLHIRGLLKETFESFEKVKEFFNVTSYGTDDDGNKFVNSYEGKNYPIYGVQYHPEVIPYARKEGFNENTKNALIVSQLHAVFFTSEAEQSKHKIKDEEKQTLNLLSTYETKDFYTFKNNYFNFKREQKI